MNLLLSSSSQRSSVVMLDLITRGQFFALEAGERFTAIENSDFNLLARFNKGDNIKPILAQREAIGFNLLRIWTLYNVNTIGVELLSCPYDKIPNFVSLCSSYNLRVEFTAYVQPELQDQMHWTRLINASMISSPKPILELMNENDQHSIDIYKFGKPIGLLSSRGSNGSEHGPVGIINGGTSWVIDSNNPPWDYLTFHTNGANEEQRKAGHNAMELWNGVTLTNETSRYPDVGIWNGASLDRAKQLAYDMGAGAALLCGGINFNCGSGHTSDLFNNDEVAVAKALVAGAKSVDLECQDGPYTHRQDLEAASGDLRDYERPVQGHGCLVGIRK